MPRYGLNLRPLYDRDEPVPGEGFSRGISGALDTYLQREKAKKQERMGMEERGFETAPDDPSPSPGERITGAVNKVKTFFGHPGAEARAAAEAPANQPTPQSPTATMNALPTQPRARMIGDGSVLADQATGPVTPPAASSISDALTPWTVHGEYANYRQSPSYMAAQGHSADVAAQRKYRYEELPRLMAEREKYLAEQAALDRRNRETVQGRKDVAATSAAARVASRPDRQAADSRTRAETQATETKQREAEADRIVQSIHAQNPGRKVSPDTVQQYYGGLRRNGRTSVELSLEELYAALDRYHNPPNRPPSATQSITDAIAGLGTPAAGQPKARRPVADVDAELKARGLNARQRADSLSKLGYTVQLKRPAAPSPERY